MFHVDNYVILWYNIYRYKEKYLKKLVMLLKKKAVDDRRAKGRKENGKRNDKGKYKL